VGKRGKKKTNSGGRRGKSGASPWREVERRTFEKKSKPGTAKASWFMVQHAITKMRRGGKYNNRRVAKVYTSQGGSPYLGATTKKRNDYPSTEKRNVFPKVLLPKGKDAVLLRGGWDVTNGTHPSKKGKKKDTWLKQLWCHKVRRGYQEKKEEGSEGSG